MRVGGKGKFLPTIFLESSIVVTELVCVSVYVVLAGSRAKLYKGFQKRNWCTIECTYHIQTSKYAEVAGLGF
uniref:Uncharacterized protein n=1 Tax=Octopus bimaculoides TaxID=37653 RepID=A0A0L8G195_OCTBM